MRSNRSLIHVSAEEDEETQVFNDTNKDSECTLKLSEIKQIKIKISIYFKIISVFNLVFLFFYIVYFFLDIIKFFKNRAFKINSVSNLTITLIVK
jgi:hypothetical protein